MKYKIQAHETLCDIVNLLSTVAVASPRALNYRDFLNSKLGGRQSKGYIAWSVLDHKQPHSVVIKAPDNSMSIYGKSCDKSLDILRGLKAINELEATTIFCHVEQFDRLLVPFTTKKRTPDNIYQHLYSDTNGILAPAIRQGHPLSVRVAERNKDEGRIEKWVSEYNLDRNSNWSTPFIGGHPIFLLFMGQEWIGACSTPLINEKRIWLRKLFVRPDFRGIGAGRFLMWYVCNSFKGKELHMLVDNDNRAAFRLYFKLGFTSYGENCYASL